ncbi:BTAD domain-containing putative transcriptional regulator [Streptomyces sp. NPDC127068]|uniref:AfsR/SARP family transcriptional regulator n=1 Tax=Streptomyces sp. NPDC127068 TaxID=3347127 RepID=UPI00364819E4
MIAGTIGGVPGPPAVAFRALGALELSVSGDPVHIGADKQRVLLALLLAHDGRTVPTPVLVREIWGDEPPPSAVANLRTYVMKLRRWLHASDTRLTTSRSGYLLQIGEADFDLPRFRATAARANRAAAQRRLPEAAELYAQALNLWRGLPLENVTPGTALREFTQHLTELHLNTVEEQAGVETALGRHGTVVQQLRQVIELHPLHERLRGRLMLALYRNGDIAGALGAFGAARATLRDELGMDPGPELSRLHQAVLSRDPTLLVPQTPTETAHRATRSALARGPRQLPAESTVFVGRHPETERADQALRAATSTANAGATRAATLVFHGQGGFGKSALALHHAHTLAPWYPDGQLYTDLAETAPHGPPQTIEVITGFLRALGVPPARIPGSATEAAMCFSSVLAGRRMLILADNARHASQILPLIPANNDCAVLVTSRSSLPTLVATRIPVGALDEASSVRLLAQLGGGERFVREEAAAVRLAGLCGHHPLALRIAGARLAGRPEWTLTGFAERLRHRAHRLDELQAEGLSVRACIHQSYRQLLGAARTGSARLAPTLRLLRLLGLHGDDEFDVAHVAALLGSDERRAADALDQLVEAQLIDPVTEDTFRIHELTRLYAAELDLPDLTVRTPHLTVAAGAAS